MKKLLLGITALLFSPLIVGAVNVIVPTAPSAGYFLVSTTTGAWIATSTPNFAAGLNISATSTGSKGINLAGGCFAVNGTCITSGSGGIGTSTNPFIATYFIATSTTIASQLPEASTTNVSASDTVYTPNVLSSGTLILTGGTSKVIASNAEVELIANSKNTIWDGTNLYDDSMVVNGSLGTTANHWNSLWVNNATTTSQYITGITSSVLATDASGQVIATSSIGANIVTGVLGVTHGGTGVATVTGCLTGNGTGVITGLGTCNTSNASVSSVATDGTLTGGPITTTGTLGINLANANSWTKLQQFTNATSTLFTSTTSWIGTLNLTNALPIASGGTATSTQVTNGVNFFDGTKITSIPTFLFSGGILSVNTTSQAATLNVGGTVNITSAYELGGTNALQFSGTVLTIPSSWTQLNLSPALTVMNNASTTRFSVNGNEVSGERYLSLGDSTTTAWTATSSNASIIAPFAGTLNSTQCSTATSSTDTTGTYKLNIQFYIGSTPVVPMLSASTTQGTVTFTSGNTFTKGQMIQMYAGTPTNSPIKISCTPIATGF